MNSKPHRLIVNADDFGRSHSINEAVVRAHREGILTSASLMVNESSFSEAVALTRENPRLGVGLHLTLVCGKSALSCEKIPELVDSNNAFSNNATSAGFRYFFNRNLISQLREEIAAQFEKFHATGLKLDHVNGHLNIHLHPVILNILLENAKNWGIQQIRLTSDPLGINTRISSGNWSYRLSHYLIYRLLSGWARPKLKQHNILHTERVFGLLQNSRMDEQFVATLLRQLPAGDSELYSHPSLDEFKNELDALISPAVKKLIAEHQIQLIRYQDLA